MSTYKNDGHLYGNMPTSIKYKHWNTFSKDTNQTIVYNMLYCKITLLFTVFKS